MLWVLQDFNMSMVDEQQNPLTAGDYLEALLSLTLSRDAQNLSKLALALENSQIRMARQEVSDLFDDRDCVALPSPLGQYVSYQQQASSGQTRQGLWRQSASLNLYPFTNDDLGSCAPAFFAIAKEGLWMELH